MIDYEKYQNRSVVQVDELRLSKIKEIPFHKEMYYKNINRIVTAPSLEPMIGYKKFEDGSAVCASYTRIDGVTKEMIHWWNIWAHIDPKRYLLLFPQKVLQVSSLSKKDEKQFTDDTLPYFERKWDSEFRLIEKSKCPVWMSKLFGKIGNDLGDVSYRFKRPIEVGIDESLFEDGELDKFICAVAFNPLFDFPITIVHYMIEDESGVEIHSRFWLGVQFNGKKFVRVGNKKIPLTLLKNKVKHCLEEYTSLGGILQELYVAENTK